MGTISIQLNAEALGKSLKNLSIETTTTLQSAVASLAQGAYSEAIRLANERLKTTRQDYINALEFESIGDNIYVITLKGEHANAIEDGYASYDQKPGLLAGPNAKVNAKGGKYNTVPFYHTPTSKAPVNTKMTNLREAVQKLLKDRDLNKIIKDDTGQPLQGVVARITDTGIRDLEGLIKVQKQYGKRTQSSYVTFRRVGENSDPSKWMHPGYGGCHIFTDVENFINRELDNILKAIL